MPTRPAAGPARRSAPAVRTAVVWDVLDTLVAERAGARAAPLDVVDVGGGTGGFAVPLAALGHRVTVVDPSPDALAALQRRAAEAGVGRPGPRRAGRRGHRWPRSSATGAADLVLCHGVLEYVDDPRRRLDDAVDVLRPAGCVSLLVAQRLGAVLARALSGRFAEARRLLDDPDGRVGEHDPLPRRFDERRPAATLLSTAAPVAGPRGPRGPAVHRPAARRARRRRPRGGAGTARPRAGRRRPPRAPRAGRPGRAAARGAAGSRGAAGVADDAPGWTGRRAVRRVSRRQLDRAGRPAASATGCPATTPAAPCCTSTWTPSSPRSS